MATPTKIIVCLLTVVLLVFVFNRWIVMNLTNDALRARLLRFQLTVLILNFMALLNCFVWRNLSTLLDSGRNVTGSGSTQNYGKWRFFVDFKEIVNWRSYTVNGLIWRLVLAVVQISSMFTYASFSFLIATEPYTLTFWLFLCFGTVVQLFCGLIFMKVLIFIWKLVRQGYRVSPKHYKLHRVFVLIYALLIVSVGFYNVLKPPEIKEVSIPIKDLSTDMKGFTITFVSDIHLGPTIGKKRLERVVHMINYLQSDLVIIGGDLVDGTVDQLGEAVESLEWINSKYGTYFVTGNHEYYTADADNWIHKLSTLGVTTLHNSNVDIGEKNGAKFCLAGVDDPTADQYRYMDHTMDLDKALKSCGNAKPVILVAHQPQSAKDALKTEYRVDLVLSGHTHGGQMFPLVIGAYLLNPYYAGLYHHNDDSQSHVYVSMGTLYWGFPIRFGTRSEITKITLVKNEKYN